MSTFEPPARKPAIRDRLKRVYVPEAIYFITANTKRRRPVFARPGAIPLLRETMHAVQEHHPFGMRAYVFLHDHLHLLLYIPQETTITRVMHSIKRNFTINYKKAYGISGSLSLWQRRFYDHVIRNERDYLQHLHYIHYNPVKHGYVARPADYPDSSFLEYVKRGWYGLDWGSSEPDDIKGMGLE